MKKYKISKPIKIDKIFTAITEPYQSLIINLKILFIFLYSKFEYKK